MRCAMRAGSAYLIGTADRFEVVIGMPAWCSARPRRHVTGTEPDGAVAALTWPPRR